MKEEISLNKIKCFSFVPSKLYLAICTIGCFAAVKAQDTVEFQCRFAVLASSEPNREEYICEIRNVVLSNRDAPVIITGQHVGTRGDENVTSFEILESEMEFIPEILYTSFFNADLMVFANAGVREFDPLPELPNLIRLFMAGNDFSTIRNNKFINIGNLRILDLIANNIHTLELDAFVGLENLEQLNLQFNQLTDLEPGTFSALINLDSIDLFLNNLQFIEMQLFAENQNLRTLNLDGNNINRIAPGFISSLPNLSSIRLISNQCISNVFSLNAGDRTLALAFIHSSLQQCYHNFVGNEPNSARTVHFEYRGSLRLFDEFGNAILTAN